MRMCTSQLHLLNFAVHFSTLHFTFVPILILQIHYVHVLHIPFLFIQLNFLTMAENSQDTVICHSNHCFHAT